MNDKDCLKIMESSEVDEATSSNSGGIKGRMVFEGNREDVGTFVVPKGSPSASDIAQCALCLMTMSSRRNLMKHERDSHKPTDFRCSDCKKKFMSSTDLRRLSRTREHAISTVFRITDPTLPNIKSFDVEGLSENIEAHMSSSSPNVMSIDRNCLEHGYRFTWESGEKPYLTSPTGARIDVEVHQNIPYLAERSFVI